MKQQSVKSLVNYWLKTAERDYDTMLILYKNKRYSECLFFGHIVLEKILKAHAAKQTKKQAPYIHNLVRLQEIAKLGLPRETLSLLAKVNDFNIRTRYPEFKLQFYKLCTKIYTDKYLKQIIDLYKHLCLKLKQKK